MSNSERPTACLHSHIERYGTRVDPAKAARCVECDRCFVSEDHLRWKLDKMAAPIEPVLPDSFDLGYMQAVRELREWLTS